MFRPVFYPYSTGATAKPQDKSIKQDLENAGIIQLQGRSLLLAFGSGSIEKTRTHIFYAAADSIYNNILTARPAFYRMLRQQLRIGADEMNIEGSFSTPDSFFLLNRGSNHLIGMSLSSVEKMLAGDVHTVPEITARHYTLPMADSFPVAFSGACFYKEDIFLFTASVEKTSNWVQDGAIGGSWIGMAKTDGSLVFLLPLKDSKGKLVKQKLESVDILHHYPDGSMLLLALADNDKEGSAVFWLKLEQQKD